jgi:AcrR family transcriptional regulator
MPGSSRNYTMQARARAVEDTRNRIVTAARDAFVNQRYEQVTLAAVARHAGVTQQTLLNHFSSKEGLFLAFIDVVAVEITDLRGVVEPSDIAGTVAALMRQYEVLGDANVRLAAAAEIIPNGAEIADGARRLHAQWLEGIFADRLPMKGPAHRRAIAALYAITDVGTWKLLRRDLRHSRAETSEILQTLIRSVLDSLETST